MLVVDAANVIGSRPTGWWRDRAGAAARFVHDLRDALDRGAIGDDVVVVLEGAARPGAAAGRHGPGLDVLHAPGSGDDAIVRAVADADAGTVRVVTADRGLRARVQALGADVLGPSWLLDRC